MPGRSRNTIIVLFFVFVGTALSLLVTTGDRLSGFSVFLFALLIVFGLLGFVFSLRLFIGRGARDSAYLQKLNWYSLRAWEKERKTLSMDLHDDVAQNLSAMRIEWSDICQELNEGVAPSAEKRALIGKMIEESIQSIREIAGRTRPSYLDQFGVERAIRKYCEEFMSRNDIILDYSATGFENVSLSFDIEINLFRMGYSQS